LFLSATVFLGVRGLLDEDSEGAGSDGQDHRPGRLRTQVT